MKILKIGKIHLNVGDADDFEENKKWLLANGFKYEVATTYAKKKDHIEMYVTLGEDSWVEALVFIRIAKGSMGTKRLAFSSGSGKAKVYVDKSVKEAMKVLEDSMSDLRAL